MPIKPVITLTGYAIENIDCPGCHRPSIAIVFTGDDEQVYFSPMHVGEALVFSSRLYAAIARAMGSDLRTDVRESLEKMGADAERTAQVLEIIDRMFADSGDIPTGKPN